MFRTMMPACRDCGCDEMHACHDDDGLGPCFWVDSDLCSACVVRAKVERARVMAGAFVAVVFVILIVAYSALMGWTHG